MYDHRALAQLREKEKTFFNVRRWTVPREPKRGITYRLGLRCKTPFVQLWKKILGTYNFPQNNHGILPLFIRAMQNNYSGGIEAISFEKVGERLFFTSREGGVIRSCKSFSKEQLRASLLQDLRKAQVP